MRLYDWLADSPPPAKESASDATSPMTGDGTRHAAPLQGQGSAVGETALPSLEEQEQAARLQMAAEQRQKREALKAEFEAAETEAEWAKAAEAKAAAAAAEEAAAAAAKEAACRALREKATAEEARRRVTYRRSPSMVLFWAWKLGCSRCLLGMPMPSVLQAASCERSPDKCSIEPRRQKNSCTCLQLTLGSRAHRRRCGQQRLNRRMGRPGGK